MTQRNSRLPISILEFAALAAIYLLLDVALDAIGFDKQSLPSLPILKQSWIGFVIVLGIIAWIKMRGASLSDFGVKPLRPLWLSLLLGIVGVVVAIVLSSVTTPLIEAHFGPTDLTALEGLEGNLGAYLFCLPFIWLFAAFGEEFFYRGFLMSGIAVILGGGRAAWLIALVVQAVIFGLGHGYQDASGMIGAGLYGVVYGGLFLAAKRNIWAPMIAHGLLDTLGFTLLYLGMM